MWMGTSVMLPVLVGATAAWAAGAADDGEAIMRAAIAQATARDEVVDVRMRRVDGVACTQLEATPREPREGAYGKRVYWIDRAKNAIHRVEFYDRTGERFKTLANDDLVLIGGYYRWPRGEMVNARKRHRTLLEFSNWRIEQGLNDRYFTVRYLERGM